MKYLLSIAASVCTSLMVSSQPVRTTTTNKVSTPSTIANKNGVSKAKPKAQVKPGPAIKSRQNLAYADTTSSSTTSKTQAAKSPFVSGIHAASDAAKTFDTVAANSQSANRAINTTAISTTAISSDTIHNVNTTIENGVSTTSGAVDKSGQSQFGQSNWGRNNRNTIGESQWTVPPPVTSAFQKQFPEASSTTWQKTVADTSLFFARYKAGPDWAYSTYNSSGQLISTHIEILRGQAPQAVTVYLAKQPASFKLSSIALLQMQGKTEVYEIKTEKGKTIYINNDGVETTLP